MVCQFDYLVYCNTRHQVGTIYELTRSLLRFGFLQVVSSTPHSDGGGDAAAGLFRKRYDAYPSGNALGGTCMVGQLLDEGYEQERANGGCVRFYVLPAVCMLELDIVPKVSVYRNINLERLYGSVGYRVEMGQLLDAGYYHEGARGRYVLYSVILLSICVPCYAINSVSFDVVPKVFMFLVGYHIDSFEVSKYRMLSVEYPIESFDISKSQYRT